MKLSSQRIAILGLLCFTAFILRAAFFYYWIAPHSYYKQPDSMDYHSAAVCMSNNYGMSKPNGEPIFWRTPGYPLYLSYFYKHSGIRSTEFAAYHKSQTSSIWMQILFCSTIPAIIALLALEITASWLIAFIAALMSVFHIGYIFASTYLLTDGLASILFYLFLLFFFRTLRTQSFIDTGTAVLSLSIYTWMRPMGELVGIVSAVLIFFFAQGPWRNNIRTAISFISIFVLSLFPWYWRNYRLTGQWFFCPTLGPYLTCFCAPKIVSRLYNITLLQAYHYCQQIAGQAIQAARMKLAPLLVISPLASLSSIVPIVWQHPGWFAYDWIVEVCKTLFDLHSYQFVSQVQDTYWYDPLQEFLWEKVSACWYKASLSWWMRGIVIFETLYMIILWIGLLVGAWIYIVQPLWQRSVTDKMLWYYHRIWLVASVLIGISTGLSGGFGYARLRLPVEPLMLILALIAWRYLTCSYTKSCTAEFSHDRL